MSFKTTLARPLVPALVGLLVLGACTDQLDFDLRGGMGGGLDTARSVTTESAPRPTPDARGVISYPGYQVAVARRGDTVSSLAARVGLPADELARFNGLTPETGLRADEIVALPRRVSETGTGSGVDIAAIAGGAIDRAAPRNGTAGPAGATSPGVEPIRHRVGRGETAFSIARLYNVSPRALGDWNGLGPDLAVRDGQYLIIPLPVQAAVTSTALDQPTAPGAGSPTPVPPSASTPLPREGTAATAAPPSPGLGSQTTAATPRAQLSMPVQGRITRPFTRGRNDGIGFDAPAGATVSAAEAGEVMAITRDTDQMQIAVIRHASGLLTVYANIDRLSVARGDRVRRGQEIAKVAAGGPGFFHFEVRDGTTAVDPVPYLQ